MNAMKLFQEIRKQINIKIMTITDDDQLLKLVISYLEIINPDYARKFAYQWAHSDKNSQKHVLSYLRKCGCNIRYTFDDTSEEELREVIRTCITAFPWLTSCSYPGGASKMMHDFIEVNMLD